MNPAPSSLFLLVASFLASGNFILVTAREMMLADESANIHLSSSTPPQGLRTKRLVAKKTNEALQTHRVVPLSPFLDRFRNARQLQSIDDDHIDLVQLFDFNIGSGSAGYTFVTPDNTKVLIREQYGTRIWVVSLITGLTNLTLQTTSSFSDSSQDIAVTHDSSRVLAAGDSSYNYTTGVFTYNINVWSLTTGVLERTLSSHTSTVNHLVVTPDGSKLISVGQDQAIKIWSVATWELEQTQQMIDNQTPYSIDITPDGSKMVMGTRTGIRVWSLTPSLQFNRTLANSTAVRSLAITSDNSAIIARSEDNRMRRWSLTTGELIWSVQTPYSNSFRYPLALSSSKIITDGNYNDGIDIWSSTTGALEQTLQGTEGGLSIYSLAVTSDGGKIIAGAYNNRIIVWQAVPTPPPTSESFVVRYAGSTQAGFGGDSFEGNEVIVPFLVSPLYPKKISLLYDNCANTIPPNIMIATAVEEAPGTSGNLTQFDVNLALNITTLSELKNDGLPDSPLWKGLDLESNVLTFCVRVDLMADGDLVSGDETTSDSDSTSVNFDIVSIEVAIDFTAHIPYIYGVEVAAQEAEEVTVDAAVYGVSGCHCDAAGNCYDDRITYVAPAVTIDDTLDICFNVSAPGVSIVDVTSFYVYQGGLSFDAVTAGTVFYSESFSGSSAVFRSRLTSAFFDDDSLTVAVSATLQLGFSRRLGTGDHDVVKTANVNDDFAGALVDKNRRNLQDSNADSAANVAVVIEVDGVAVSADNVGVETFEVGDSEPAPLVGGGTVLIVVGCVAVVACGVILVSALVFVRRRHQSSALPRPLNDISAQEKDSAAVVVEGFKDEGI